MYCSHTVQFNQPAEVVFDAIQRLPPDYKWGEGMIYSDQSNPPQAEAGQSYLILRNAETVIEEYRETLVEIEEPFKFALTLKLEDFAMSRNAPDGHLLPDAADLSRARKRIEEGRATNLVFAVTLIQRGAETEATLTIATAGQTGPKMGARLFKRFTPNPAKTLLEWLISQLDAPERIDSSK